jgi:hypothetical protein
VRALVAVVFILLQALAAAALFLLSVHGPSALLYAAPGYLAVAAALTWWAGRKSWPLLVLAGFAFLGAAPLTFYALERIERIADERRVAGTQISDVRDEPILLAGRPVGIRVSYRVVAPKRGYFGILPSIHGVGRGEGFSLSPRQWSFDGRTGIEFGPFEPGKRHDVVVDLYPETYHSEEGNVPCFRRVVRPLPPPGAPVALRIEISDSPYGSIERGGREERTRGTYDMASLLGNVAVAGVPPCKVQP